MIVLKNKRKLYKEEEEKQRYDALNEAEKRLANITFIGEEVDYLIGEKFNLDMNIYDLTIGANLSNGVSPIQTLIPLKKCFFTWATQLLVYYFLVLEDLGFNNF